MIKAYSPGTVGNLGCGFDLLGHCIDGVGDTVCATKVPKAEKQARVFLEKITGVVTDLPVETSLNTATRAVQALLDETKPDFDVLLTLDKGIPLGSGMGGSAASATAALVATNALFNQPMKQTDLYPFALAGESIASASAVGDNVGPQLLGGLTLATASQLIALPTPAGLTAVILHPKICIETATARKCLQPPFPLADITAQQAALAQLLIGLYTTDYALISQGLKDYLIEPRREHMIPQFRAFKQMADSCGALGSGLSGAGPSVFAWFKTKDQAVLASERLRQSIGHEGAEVDLLISSVSAGGAHILS